MTAFGQDGPRGTQTAYDHAIQATSGITASTGTETSGPIKAGAPMIDYATGTMGAFAISAALFQTHAHRQGPAHRPGDARRRHDPAGLAHHRLPPLGPSSEARRQQDALRRDVRVSDASDGLVQLAASNARQHRRFYEAIGDPEEAKRASLEERYARYEEKQAKVAEKMKEKTADEWETYLQRGTCPPTRVRELREALADPQLKTRGVLHRHEKVPGVGKPVTVPLAAFKFAHDGPSIERPPARRGRAHGRGADGGGLRHEQIAALRRSGAMRDVQPGLRGRRC